MKLIAIKNHPYRGRSIAAGQKFEAPPADAIILLKAGLARAAPPEKKVEVKKVVEPKVILPVPEKIVETEARAVSSNYDLREEVAEEQGQGDDPNKLSRKEKRQYKRKDMDPEK